VITITQQDDDLISTEVKKRNKRGKLETHNLYIAETSKESLEVVIEKTLAEVVSALSDLYLRR
jgi:hypothetical protein